MLAPTNTSSREYTTICHTTSPHQYVCKELCFGANKSITPQLYCNTPYNTSIPILRDVMKRDAFKFLQLFMHVCDNNKRKLNDTVEHTLLLNASYALVLTKLLTQVWASTLDGPLTLCTTVKQTINYVINVSYLWYTYGRAMLAYIINVGKMTVTTINN